MKYDIKRIGELTWDVILKEPATLNDLINHLAESYESCYIKIECGDLYELDWGELKEPIHQLLLNTEIEHIWIEKKLNSNNLKSNSNELKLIDTYLVRLKGYREKYITDEEVKCIAFDYFKSYNNFLDILSKEIFPDDSGKVVSIIDGIKCDSKGPYILYKYIKDYLEGFGNYYFKF